MELVSIHVVGRGGSGVYVEYIYAETGKLVAYNVEYICGGGVTPHRGCQKGEYVE